MANESSFPKEYLTQTADLVLQTLRTSHDGLREKEVLERQRECGLNIIHKRDVTLLSIFARQFTSNPLILVLAAATAVAYLLGQHISSYYIFGLIIASLALGIWNEYSAERTIDGLLKKIAHLAIVIRDGEKKEVPASHLTVGDIVFLQTGSIIPADLRLIEAKDLEIDQSALTGESKTVYKSSHALSHATSSIDELSNVAFMGTHVQSGSGKGVIIQIGKSTQYGKIAKSVTFLKPITEFQKGLNTFGQLILKIILIMTVIIFVVNAVVGHSVLNSALFALAIAVGLTPELLPVIVTVSLSHGAGRLAKKFVVAKQLIAIENLGSMDVLCTDKTGTLTEGKIEVVNYVNDRNIQDPHILKMALLCNEAVVHHKILGNAIDVALWQYALKKKISPPSRHQKIDEEPFDYVKKAMYSVIEDHKQYTLIAKGAPDTILSLCNHPHKKELHEHLVELNKQGYRLIALASKPVAGKKSYSWDDAQKLTFAGYITLSDTPKKSAKSSLLKFAQLHIQLKVVTGDNEIVTHKVCEEVGMPIDKTLLGADIDALSDDEFRKKVEDTTIFARVNPTQKLRIIEALRKNGHTVGYLGDGINDIPALHTADVGISVNTAIDVAKDSASIVLLRKSLRVLADGIIEGRETFNNTIKYILMATSANFGNMFSAASMSFLLPFLPITPVQILLTNGLYDVSQIGIPSDNVDPESLLSPRHWNINFIKDYMIFFGPLSSLFDFMTFGILIFFFHAKDSLFQTGWFIESLVTQVLVVFIVRTARTPFWKSRPSKWLLLSSFSMVGIALWLPFSPLAPALHFVAPSPSFFAILVGLTLLYLGLVEVVKKVFLKKYSL